jgi:hypothetical protein
MRIGVDLGGTKIEIIAIARYRGALLCTSEPGWAGYGNMGGT